MTLLFNIPLKLADTYEPLDGLSLTRLEKRFQHIHYVIIDEKSIVGCKLLEWILGPFSQTKPAAAAPGGGLSIHLVGDFRATCSRR